MYATGEADYEAPWGQSSINYQVFENEYHFYNLPLHHRSPNTLRRDIHKRFKFKIFNKWKNKLSVHSPPWFLPPLQPLFTRLVESSFGHCPLPSSLLLFQLDYVWGRELCTRSPGVNAREDYEWFLFCFTFRASLFPASAVLSLRSERFWIAPYVQSLFNEIFAKENWSLSKPHYGGEQKRLVWAIRRNYITSRSGARLRHRRRHRAAPTYTLQYRRRNYAFASRDTPTSYIGNLMSF